MHIYARYPEGCFDETVETELHRMSDIVIDYKISYSMTVDLKPLTLLWTPVRGIEAVAAVVTTQDFQWTH